MSGLLLISIGSAGFVISVILLVAAVFKYPKQRREKFEELRDGGGAK